MKKTTTKFKEGESPDIYRKIYETSLDAILIALKGGRIISANATACSLFGMTLAELVKITIYNMVDHGDPRLILLVEERDKTGKSKGEITLIRKNGFKFPAEVSSSSIINEDGELIIILIIRELLGRSREEEELRENFSRYQLALDATNDGIWDMDMKMKQVFVSPNALKLFGYKDPKKVHMDDLWDNIIIDDDKKSVINEFKPALEGQTDLIDTECRVNTFPDGWKWIRMRGKVLSRESSGGIIRMIGTFADISKRKRIEKELERSNKEFQSYFENGSIGLSVTAPDKSWIAVNQAACQMFGYSKEELTGLSWIDLTHPDDIQENLDLFNQSIEGKIDNYRVEKRFIKKDGSIIYVNLSVVCSRNEDGSVHHFLASYIDTTERNKYIETLKNERKLLRTLIDNLPFTVYVIDKEGRKVISNKADLDTIGSNTEVEVLGKTDIELFPGEVGKRGHADNMTVINTGSPILNHEEDFIDNKGHRKWLLTTKVPLFDTNNKIMGLIGIGIDITEQKLLQQKITDSESYYRTLVNISPDGIIVTDLKGNITFHSKKVFQIFRVPENIDLINESIFNWIAPDSLDKAILNFRSVLRGERIAKTDAYRSLKYDKTEFWADLSSSPLHDTSGKPKGLMIICRDISDRKEAEGKLIFALNKAEESDKLKTALLRNISHEIRTPMNSILGFSALLGEPGLSDELMMSYIETIQSSSNQLLTIINDLVDISTIEANIVKKKISELNLNEMVLSVHNQFKLRATQKNISLNIKMELSHENANIKTDRTKVVQIISNLLNNAIKFTERGEINFGYTLENQFIKFFVTDTGIGIPSEYLSKIFSPFFQVERELSRKFEGTGLGLSICKAYVELLGGKIWVTSDIAKGSSFFFTIPFEPIIRTNLLEQTTLNMLEISFSKSLTILIAEDDHNNFKFIQNLLSGLNLKTILAKNGKEAVAKCKELKDIDLVFMDLRMPGMDGYEATKQIRSILPDLPIIAQTAYVEDREKAFEYGCTDFISKPFTKQEIISIIIKNIKKK